MKTHILQSREWEKYSQTEGHETFWLEGKDFQLLAIKYHTVLGDYLYCPYGPSLDEEDPITALEHSIMALKKLAAKEKAMFVRMEPTVYIEPASMQSHGLVKTHNLDPEHTWVIDLTGTKDDLLAGIEKDKVRKWRNHEKKGLKLRTTKDPEEITILTGFLNGLGAKKHFTPQDEKHLKNQLKAGFATLYVAEFEGEPIAAALVYDYDGVRYSTHAATSGEHQNLAAGPIIAIQSMVDAQEAGEKLFDFWGMTTSTDPKHPWYGFTKYKQSFGGRQVDYTGTWDLPIHRVKYRLYTMMRQANRLGRKAKKL